ncbi:hypothetical protein [Paenibacillus taichungensis]|uniref:hypothetical protein n=1 Tax=Paenibacillus taichungensis TaxID=484184 RepID=UPI0035937192
MNSRTYFQKGKGADHRDVNDLLSVWKEEFDLVAMGRALLTDLAWAMKFREGQLKATCHLVS